MTHEHKGYTIRILPDDDPLNPRRDYDNFGTMVCWHRNYTLGDFHDYRDPEELLQELAGPKVASRLEAQYEKQVEGLYQCNMSSGEREREIRTLHRQYQEELMAAAERNAVILPLYLYDHSGITMSTSPFSCSWDSGQVGFILVTKEDIRNEFGVKRITKKVLEKAVALLEAEVETYDQYLTGDVWGYVIEHPTDGEIDSCWGFFGSDYCLDEAKAVVDAEERRRHRLLEERAQI